MIEGFIMRNLRILLLVFLALVGLTACAKKPEPVAKAFFKALENQDFEAAKKLSTQEGQQLLSLIQSLTENVSEEQKAELLNTKYQVLDTIVDGDNATVTYERWEADSPESKESLTIQLKKIDGDWKVHFVKDDLQK